MLVVVDRGSTGIRWKGDRLKCRAQADVSCV